MMLNDLQKIDYPVYYKKYIDLLPHSRLIDILIDQKQEMLSLLNQLDKKDLKYSYADGKWTVGEVLQHLIDTERIFQYRALCIARKDKTSFPGFDQDAYVDSSYTEQRSTQEFIVEYSAVRDSGISLFKSFTEEMLLEMGVSSGQGLTTAAAGFIIAGHEKHHLALFRSKYEL